MAQNKVFEDFTKLMTDASEMAQGVRREAETAMKGQLERLLGTMNLVTREEFEAVRAGLFSQGPPPPPSDFPA